MHKTFDEIHEEVVAREKYFVDNPKDFPFYPVPIQSYPTMNVTAYKITNRPKYMMQHFSHSDFIGNIPVPINGTVRDAKRTAVDICRLMNMLRGCTVPMPQ